ncbi:PREDICTED: 15-hydroxyprostaglandin dehydrogenase [NAD(+)]-like [Trachymyrmex cornetzi]|uniref:15-hydroxyprostaglandin dehydrogenase [NAD(+)] n=1 Tax=Trachymyrmex cornetzi TaxID=471704 RepID=A0A195DBD7_9HYME|nr:PREDICTED: 15-hydroxyprostaglandin dehydrogenase [NAD(+)]-like [Trachymyrmex cornetzi]KYN09729.1 15-hydroxyprostaglandin dehydrogenase [NAD+] [Trachymyrmex cornetzi]
MYDVRNKTVMITGAAGGLGYKFVEILLRNGAKSIAMIDLSTSNGQNAAVTLENEFGKGRVVFVACDVTKADDLEKTFKKIVDTFKGLDILINNAAIFNDNYWEKTIDVNVKALIRNSMMAFDYMGKHKGGKGGVIVNISSMAALEPGYFLPIYTASKCAVLGFSQSLASMYDNTGVRVIIMCPGATATPLITNISNKIYDSIRPIRTDEIVAMENMPKQTPDNVALAVLNLIQQGKNGVTWISESDQPPCAIDFPHYSKRCMPV